MSETIQSAKSIIHGILSGFKDSLFGIIAFRNIYIQNERFNLKKAQRNQRSNISTTSSSPKQPINLKHRIIECCGFNLGVFALSIWIFNDISLPLLYELMKYIFGHEGRTITIWAWLVPILKCTFQACWVLPLFILSRVVNTFWFSDIAECTLRGRSQSSRSISFFIADSLFSLLIQALFLIQSVIVGNLSYIGPFVSLLHLSFLYSLYSFEYKWFYHGWQLHRRLNYIESNWPYFVGFGLPMAIMTSIAPNYFISGSIFSSLFPLFIISTNEAKPVINNHSSLQLFTPVVFLSNRIFTMMIYLTRAIRSLTARQR